jgi:hypothetical protein
MSQRHVSGGRDAEIEAVFRANRIAGDRHCDFRVLAADNASARHGAGTFTCRHWANRQPLSSNFEHRSPDQPTRATDDRGGPTDLLGVDAPTVKKALGAWGPGRFDAELAGVNLHTWTGWKSVPYWNAYIGATEMHESGTFFDSRLENKTQFPISAKSGSYNTRGTPDRISSKLAALHFYQLAIPAPPPPVGSYAKDAADRGNTVFEGKGKCATCHVPPLFTEPGENLHTPAEVGVDAFQADRSPTHMYRTAPLAGLWSHQKGGFYHDGRFATLKDVVAHYTTLLKLTLTDREQADLIEYLKSL